MVASDPIASRNGPLAWTVHPLRVEPAWKSAALVALIAGFSTLAAASLGGAVYGLISLLALAGATARYLLPTRYVLDEREAAWRQLTWRRRSWSAFRRVDRHADGVFLSPFRRPSRLDSFRGVFLPFGPGVDADAVVALARARVPA